MVVHFMFSMPRNEEMEKSLQVFMDALKLSFADKKNNNE